MNLEWIHRPAREGERLENYALVEGGRHIVAQLVFLYRGRDETTGFVLANSHWREVPLPKDATVEEMQAMLLWEYRTQ